MEELGNICDYKTPPLLFTTDRLLVDPTEAEKSAAKGPEGAAAENGKEQEVEEASAAAAGDSGESRSTVRVTGAVEMKGIVGSDGRSYLLDVSRLTPRDANWVRGEKGTKVYDDWMKVLIE